MRALPSPSATLRPLMKSACSHHSHPGGRDPSTHIKGKPAWILGPSPPTPEGDPSAPTPRSWVLHPTAYLTSAPVQPTYVKLNMLKNKLCLVAQA